MSGRQSVTQSVATGNLRLSAKSRVDKLCERGMPKRKGGIKFTILPLTPDLWPALEDLFGKSGASNGCWCMYWRLGGGYREAPRGANRAALQQIVRRGSPPGLLAFDGDLPVGRCQLTPRDALPWLDHMWCFSRTGYRRQGAMTQLIFAALKTAKHARAPAPEGYPIDTSATKSAHRISLPLPPLRSHARDSRWSLAAHRLAPSCATI